MAEHENSPATKKDLAELETKLEARMSGLDAGLSEVKGKLSGLDAGLSEVKGKLSGLDAEMSEVKAGLSAVNAELSTVKAGLSAVQAELPELEARLSEQMRDMQTELLKAFLPWQEHTQIQFRKLEANTGNSVTSIEQRMGVMERRLWEIEKRLLMNPPAA